MLKNYKGLSVGPWGGAAGAWLAMSGEPVEGCRLAVLFRGWGERVLREIPLEECAGMIYSPQDSLPSRIVPALLWLARPQCYGTPSGVGQGGHSQLCPPIVCLPHKWLLGRKGSGKQRGKIKTVFAEPKCCGEALTITQRLLLEDAKVESEKEQEPGQVTHYG